MAQTSELPVLSLASPNIHKLRDMNVDNLSYMWTVFSRCKNNLENGRRLENISWRMWYRQTSLKEKPSQPTCLKEESTEAFVQPKRLVSTRSTADPPIQPILPVKRNSKFFINDDSDESDEFDESDDDTAYSTYNTMKSYQIESDDDNDDDYSDCGSFETIDEPQEDQIDEKAFMIEFRKRSPCNIKGQSLLTILLQTQVPPDQSISSNTYLSKTLSENI
ncbi:uncharacterized protein B0P05DRAFT_554111 [Gilbertella persicaria]|uniref:uncharacterized protein n=1 Tax=Gilbertella persicaria TaxID=101096 RepID=UPI0022203A88|nr:uncharacterized protein B0P05DRAFT_554111 [Gilbertella persicaria]KAI8065381.1 hypothetical protein B0P05DRAFT_554111 [Gilbertella persicaria]